MEWKVLGCLISSLLLLGFGVWGHDSRIERFQTLIQEKGPTLLLTTEEYKELVLKNKRTYNVALIITAGVGYQCTQCNVAVEVFHRLANEYHLRGKMNPIQPDGRRPTFFVYIDVSDDRNLIDLHGLTSVPVIAFIQPSDIFNRSTSKPSRTPLPDNIQLTQARKNIVFPQLVIDFINTKAGEPDIVIRKTPSELIKSTVFLLVLVGTTCVIGYQLLILFNRYPTLMAIVASIIQILTTSGMCWSVINGFQWVGFDRETGSTVWFSPNRRFQFVAEGLIMSSAIALSGMSLFAASYIMKNNTFRIRAISYLACLFLTLCGFFLHNAVMTIDAKKQGFSSFSFYPPTHYIKGPLHNDRGNSL